MKTIIRLFIILFFAGITCTTFAQATGGKFNYQAIIRNPVGTGVFNQTVDIRFQIYDASVAGNLAFQEDFTNVNTGDFGVVNLQVGDNGNVLLKSLNWGLVNYYVNIQMRQGGGSFTDISSNRTQLASVPYALHATKSDTARYALTSTTTPEIDADTTNELQTLTVSGKDITLSNNGGTVTLNFSVSGNKLQLNNTDVATLPDLTPPGTIAAFGGTVAPTGWALCNGQTLSRTTDAALFGVIGVNYGVGDGATTFNVPNLQGKFLRGVDNAQGNDPNVTGRTANGAGLKDAPGSTQGDATKAPNTQFITNSTGDHTHTMGAFRQSGNGYDSGSARSAWEFWGAPNMNTGSSGSHSHTISGGDNETRPKNVYVNYIIKY
jgi:microcystin-dependent protein